MKEPAKSNEIMASFPRMTEQRIQSLFATPSEIPSRILVEGRISAPFVHSLSTQLHREFGLLVLPTGERVLFYGERDGYTPSAPGMCKELNVARVNVYVHTHFAHIEYEGEKHILEAPSSSDFRVSGFSQEEVGIEVLIAGDRAMQYKAGRNNTFFEIALLLEFMGKSREDFPVTDDEVIAYLPGIEPESADFEKVRETIRRGGKISPWGRSIEYQLEEDPKRNSEFRVFIRDRISVSSESEATGNTFVRPLQDEELERLLNP